MKINFLMSKMIYNATAHVSYLPSGTPKHLPEKEENTFGGPIAYIGEVKLPTQAQNKHAIIWELSN